MTVAAPVIFTSDGLDRIVRDTIPAATDATHTNAIVGSIDQDGAQVVAHFLLSPTTATWQLNTDAVAGMTGTATTRSAPA